MNSMQDMFKGGNNPFGNLFGGNGNGFDPSEMMKHLGGEGGLGNLFGGKGGMPFDDIMGGRGNEF